MITPIQIPGFENRRIEAHTNAMSGRNSLTIDGRAATPGPKRGQFLLQTDDGREVLAAFKPAFPDTIPTLIVDGQTIRLAPKLQWYEMVWACFPILLLFVGGLIGGVMGFVGLSINLQIFRAKMPVAARYALAALVSIVCIAVWVLIGSLLQSARPR